MQLNVRFGSSDVFFLKIHISISRSICQRFQRLFKQKLIEFISVILFSGTTCGFCGSFKRIVTSQISKPISCAYFFAIFCFWKFNESEKYRKIFATFVRFCILRSAIPVEFHQNWLFKCRDFREDSVLDFLCV